MDRKFIQSFSFPFFPPSLSPYFSPLEISLEMKSRLLPRMNLLLSKLLLRQRKRDREKDGKAPWALWNENLFRELLDHQWRISDSGDVLSQENFSKFFISCYQLGMHNRGQKKKKKSELVTFLVKKNKSSRSKNIYNNCKYSVNFFFSPHVILILLSSICNFFYFLRLMKLNEMNFIT